jgi:sulfite reductase (ferredoxin)
MYHIPETYIEELTQYRELVKKTTANKTDPILFKVFRVVRGIYEQRKKGTYMVRVRCAGGTITPVQLYGLSDLAERYNSEFLHITTRQEIQMHNIQLQDTPEILEELYKMGLSTKGSGGNTVRNITASVESGISDEDVFDVTPYNIALTDFLIRNEKSFDMPRKLKIAFSSSGGDTALAAYNDLGFIAKIKNGEKGFKVFLGGSPSVKPMIGEVLFEFLPADKIFGVALAVIEMFYKHGNRKNRHQARLRYLFYKLGKEQVFQLFEEVYNQYKSQYFFNVKEFESQNAVHPKLSVGVVNERGINEWKQNYVKQQKQRNLNTVEIPVMHGNLTNNQAKAVARFAAHFGNDTIRFSRRQNIHLRNIPEPYLGLLFKTLNITGLDLMKPYLLGNLVSCTGADTCQLGICFSKGGMKAIHDELIKKDWISNLKNLSINVSGCPNACGQHLVADLGFAGKVSRNGRIYPSYNVFAGAVIGENNAALPIKLGEVAAKDLPAFTADLLFLYNQKSEGETFREFVEKWSDDIDLLFGKYSKIPLFEEDKKYYIDWGNNELFTLDARGGGECSAGLLDMIEAEIKIIEKCKESVSGQQEVEEITVLLYEIMLASSKLLSLTLKIQTNDEKELIRLVQNQFIEKEKIPNHFFRLLELLDDGNFVGILKQKDLVMSYADAAIYYYQNLDDSLQPNYEINEITASELKLMLDGGENIFLVDVREAWEKEIADIGGVLIPFGTIENNFSTIPANRKTILYCRTGRRSSEAIGLIAKKQNTENLFNLKGGIYAWADEVDKTIQKY